MVIIVYSGVSYFRDVFQVLKTSRTIMKQMIEKIPKIPIISVRKGYFFRAFDSSKFDITFVTESFLLAFEF